MPLSAPAERELIHHREINCRGYRRSDGLWDIEGHLVDTKTYGFSNRFRGEVAPGVPIHEMWLRLTVDEELLIHEAEAVTDHGPFPICPDITERFKGLAGLRIQAGFHKAVAQRVGGVLGCTHLVELLRPVATTAFQSMAGQRREREERESQNKGKTERPRLLNTCHALASSSPVVKEIWPEHFKAKEDA